MILSSFRNWLREPGFIRSLKYEYHSGQYHITLESCDAQTEFMKETFKRRIISNPVAVVATQIARELIQERPNL